MVWNTNTISELPVYPRRVQIPLGTQEGGKSENQSERIPLATIGLIS